MSVFKDINNYPVGVIKRTINDVKKQIEKQTQPSQTTTTTPTTENDQQPSVVKIYLPYAGTQGESITKEVSKSLRKIFDKKISTRVIFKSKKLSSCFNVKDKTETKHKHNFSLD